MTKRDFLKVQIALAIAGTVALGGASSVLANDTITEYKDKQTHTLEVSGSDSDPQGPITVGSGTIVNYTGNASKPDYAFTWTETNQENETDKNGNMKQGQLINVSGTLDVSGVDTLKFDATHTSDIALDGLVVANQNGKVNIHDVGNIQIGTESTKVKADQIFHGFGGTIDVNVANDFYANVTGSNSVFAQNLSGKDASVSITAGRDITIHTLKGAIGAAAFYNGGSASVNLNAGGKITLTAPNSAAVYINDSWEGGTAGNGTASVNVYGKEGVLLEGGNGIKIQRVVEDKAQSNVSIKSDKDVVIKASGSAVYVYSKESSDTITLEGNAVQLESEKRSAAVLVNGNLKVHGDTIQLKAGNGIAANVSGTNGKLDLGNGTDQTTINVDGRIQVTDGGTVNFADNTTTFVESKYLKDSAFITTKGTNGVADGNVTADKGSQFVVKDFKTGDTLYFSDNETLNDQMNANGQLKADTALQKLTISNNGNGEIKVEQADAADREKALAGTVLKNVVQQAVDEGNTDLKPIFFYADGSVNGKAANSVASFGELAGFSHSTYTASNLFTDAVGAHLTDGVSDNKIWASYVHGKESVDGLGLAGGIGANYDATYDGAVVGIDLYQSGNTTAGAAISYVNGSIEGSGVKNDADFYGLAFYGRKDLAKYSLVGDVSYLHGSHDITASIGSGTFAAKPDVDAFSVGIKALKDFQLTETSKLTPYVGARYLRINTESYNSGSLHYDADSQDLFLVPVGVDYSADFHKGAWTYRPMVGVGYIWNAAGRSVDQTVSYAGAADSFSFDTVDKSSFIARVGLSAEKDNLSFGVGYQYEDSDSASADKWMVNAAYRF